MKELAIIFGILGTIVGLVFLGPVAHKYFGKEYADADREIHQTSLSYVNGSIKNLQRLKLAYEKAETEQHKKIIAETALTEVSTIDETKLPPNLMSWIRELRTPKGN